MTDVSESADLVSQTDSPASVGTPASAGLLLQQARERAGVHLGMLSVALKVPVRQLMALEADDHAQLSGPVFVRGLANSVCRQLRIESAPILALLPQGPTHLQDLPPSLESASISLADRLSGWRRPVNRQFFLLIALLLVLIGLVLGLPEWPATSASAPAAPALATETESSAAPVPSPPVSANAPMVVVLPSEAAAEPAAATALAASKPPSVSTAALEVTFKGKGDDAWVEVKDGSGAVVFNKLVRSGDTHVVKGVPVLTVVVGLADAVDVWVRGQALDLTPFSRGAVARFEVK